MSISERDRQWLDAAVRYATPFLGTTADGPTVGALLVDPTSNRLVSRAVTGKNGRPHAEAVAIEAAGFEAAGCTLYITLEPCHSWGRTPPCVDAIIRSGIMRVVIGARDSDPAVPGASVTHLESAGVETIIADHAPSRSLHAGNVLRYGAARPHVTAVVAVDAHGVICPMSDNGVGASSQQWIDLQRTRSEAVMISSATASADDPSLVVQLDGLSRRTPLRVVLAGSGVISRKLNLIGGFSGYRTAIIAELDAPIDAPVSVQVIRVKGQGGRPDLSEALTALSARGVQNLLVQPGKRLTAALLEANLVDRFAVIKNVESAADVEVSSRDQSSLEDLLHAAGLTKGESQQLGDALLTVFERSPQPE